jgi:hypothetical protein
MTATPPLIDTFPEPVAAVCVGARRRVGLRTAGAPHVQHAPGRTAASESASE